MSVVHRGDLENDREVSAGTDGDRRRRDVEAEDVRRFALEPHAVVRFVLVPLLEFYDNVDLFRVLDGAHTEDAAHVDDADAAELDEVFDYRRRGADERLFGNALDLDGVVGDETVTSLDELDRRFALAYPAVAEDEHTFAVYLDEHAVARDARGERDGKERDQRGLEARGRRVRAVKRYFIRAAGADDFVERGERRRYDYRGRQVRAELFEAVFLLCFTLKTAVLSFATTESMTFIPPSSRRSR